MSEAVKISPAIMVAALRELAAEGNTWACSRELTCTDFEWMVDLEGADFQAGELVRIAVEGGFDPKRIVEFFIAELRPKVHAWERPLIAADEWEEVRSKTSDSEEVTRYRKEVLTLRDKVAALQAMGLARMILAGEVDLDHDGLNDIIADRFMVRSGEPELAKRTKVVQAAWALSGFALDIITTATTDVLRSPAVAAEHSVRALVRLMYEVGDGEFDHAGLLTRLREFLQVTPPKAPTKRSPRRKAGAR